MPNIAATPKEMPPAAPVSQGAPRVDGLQRQLFPGTPASTVSLPMFNGPGQVPSTIPYASGAGTTPGRSSTVDGDEPKAKRNEADAVKVPQLPSNQQFNAWKIALRDEIAGASGAPDEGFKWFLEVQKARSIEDLADSGVFPSLDVKLNAALARITTGELGRRINLQKEKYALQEKYLKGRQVLWLIFEFYKVADIEGGINSMRDLLLHARRQPHGVHE